MSPVDNADGARAANARYRIVGFEVEPYTVKHAKKVRGPLCEWSTGSLPPPCAE